MTFRHSLTRQPESGLQPARSSEAQAAASRAPDDAQQGATAAHVISSQSILKGQKSVIIQHGSASYQLRATRLGKLILTK